MAGRSIRSRAPGPERPGRGNPLWAAACDYARNLLGSGPLLRKARARRLQLYADELAVAVAGGDGSEDLEELLAALPARVPRPARALGLRPRENLARIARVFGLGEAEAEVLRFLLWLNLEDGLSSLTGELGELSAAGVARAIATATALPHRAVVAAIAPESPLFASGLVELDPCAPMTVKSKFDVAPVLLDLLERRIADDDALRAVFVRRCRARS